MSREQITRFLNELLEREKLRVLGVHWAREVSIDPFIKDKTRRVDYMSFKPAGACYVSDIEKGIFTCYEIKSCKDDVYSGNGLNFIGEKNYLVTTMECYKDILPDLNYTGKFQTHMDAVNPDSQPVCNIGIMVAIPAGRDINDEFENPTPIGDGSGDWRLYTIKPCRAGRRRRSMIEMMFCMLRSGH